MRGQLLVITVLYLVHYTLSFLIQASIILSLWCKHIYICIVGVTGNALPDDIARFIANGASEVITKPLTKSKLLGAISRYKEL